MAHLLVSVLFRAGVTCSILLVLERTQAAVFWISWSRDFRQSCEDTAAETNVTKVKHMDEFLYSLLGL